MQTVRAVVATALVWSLAACGGGNVADSARTAAAAGAKAADDGGSGSADDAGGGDAASSDASFPDEGMIVIEVDGQTFEAQISECLVNDTTFQVSPRPDGPGVSLSVSRIAGESYVVQASAVREDGSQYNGSSAGGVHPTIDGNRVSFSVDFTLYGADLADVGEGHVSASCPETASVADGESGGSTASVGDPNTIVIGDRIWTRDVGGSVGQCLVQEEGPNGLEALASAWGPLDGDPGTQLEISVDGDRFHAEVKSDLYYWIAGPRSTGVDDLEIEFDADANTLGGTGTMRGTGTFTNVMDGTSAPGSFEMMCGPTE